MTLFVLAHEHIRQSDDININIIKTILKRKNLKLSALPVPSNYTDELIYKLGRINRC
jgi:hypothetical protein